MERKTALVTGASSGIGLATSIGLAQAGYRVFASMRNLARRGPLESAAAQAAVDLEVVELDVTDHPCAARAAEALHARAGHLDLLVNNAGVGFIGALEDTEDDEYRNVFDTNFFGLVSVTRAVVPYMRRARKGCIINVSSLGGRVPLPGLGVYAASKFAVEGFSDALRRELRPFGIRVVVVQPGAIRTPMIGPGRQVARAAREEQSPYRATLTRVEALMDRVYARGTSLSPADVARRVVTIANKRAPSARYLVGADAHLLGAMQAMLPDSLIDWAAVKLFDSVNSSA